MMSPLMFKGKCHLEFDHFGCVKAIPSLLAIRKYSNHICLQITLIPIPNLNLISMKLNHSCNESFKIKIKASIGDPEIKRTFISVAYGCCSFFFFFFRMKKKKNKKKKINNPKCDLEFCSCWYLFFSPS